MRPAHQIGSLRYEYPPAPTCEAEPKAAKESHVRMSCFLSHSIACTPALSPVLPAVLRPLFLMMKLAPMKIEELTANVRPMI
jgi:hypothetical protein